MHDLSTSLSNGSVLGSVTQEMMEREEHCWSVVGIDNGHVFEWGDLGYCRLLYQSSE
jgi:hypothetical protein